VEYRGAIYHVTVRSNGGSVLFKDDKDRWYLLGRIEEAGERHGVRVYLFCLMRNHFHLVLETPRGNLGQFMQGVLTGYGVYYNLRHRSHGHVTQGRYGARLVDGNEYLLKLSRYVHLNPVKIGAVRSKPLAERLEMLRTYPWSSYRGYVGLAARRAFVEHDPVLDLMDLMDGSKTKRGERYRAFVESGVAEDDGEFAAVLGRSVHCIGSDDFREEVEVRYAALLGKGVVREDASFRRRAGVLRADRIMAMVAVIAGLPEEALRTRRRDCRWRAVAARMLCRYGGLTQRDVAETLGVRTGVAVSCQLRRLTQLLESDLELGSVVQRIEKQLDKEQAKSKH